MKRTWQSRLFSLVLMMALTIGMVGFSVTEASAAGKFDPYPQDPTMWVGQKVQLSGSEGLLNATITSVKSNHPGIVKVTKTATKKVIYNYSMTAKKKGKAVITIKFKTKAGKKMTKKLKVQVKPYPYQIKKLTLNGKGINVRKNKFEYTKSGYTKTNARLKLQMKKGWSVSYVYARVETNPNSDGNYKSKEINVTPEMITDGKAIKFPAKYDKLDLDISMWNEKYEIISYNILITRD